MPITPLHFGPAATLAIPLQKYIDLPAFLLANVIVDVEPLYVMLSGTHYPLHGYIHTLLFGGLAGALLGFAIFLSFHTWYSNMKRLHLPYSGNLMKSVLSGVFGAWMHVLTDSIIYKEMNPFYPIAGNPLYDLLSKSQLYYICLILFAPAVVLYFIYSKPSFR